MSRLHQLSDLLGGYQGVVVVQTKTSSRNGSRLLREQLAESNATGLSRDALLRSVTVDAARLIGCEKQIGAIAPGYKADLVGFLGNPLDTTSPIALIMANGKLHKEPKPDAVVSNASSQVMNHGGSRFPVTQFADQSVLKSSRFLLQKELSQESCPSQQER